MATPRATIIGKRRTGLRDLTILIMNVRGFVARIPVPSRQSAMLTSSPIATKKNPAGV